MKESVGYLELYFTKHRLYLQRLEKKKSNNFFGKKKSRKKISSVFWALQKTCGRETTEVEFRNKIRPELLPDRPFNNFRTSNWVDQRFQATGNPLIDEFKSSDTVIRISQVVSQSNRTHFGQKKTEPASYTKEKKMPPYRFIFLKCMFLRPGQTIHNLKAFKQSISMFYLIKKHQNSYFEALKLRIISRHRQKIITNFAS